VKSSSIQRYSELVIKRAFDIALSLAGLLVIWPAMLIIAVAIKIDTRGPVFYRGVRSGLKGNPFRIFKFRTMTMDAERAGGYSTAKNDPRITRMGRLLRRHKLDEFPQLFNVLKGEMSFVGPRPEIPAYTEMYSEAEKLILTVKPGITDYSSMEFIHLDDVLGATNADLVYEEKVKPIKNALRMKYVREASLLTDLRIFRATLLKLIGISNGVR
jgi:lipopolysaccharide/colanic/teichoic acid biosynthesis glycosyltransferase